MGSLLVLLLGFVLVLLVLMLGAIWAMNRVAGRMVGDKHRLIQGIIETGTVPGDWRRPFARRFAALERDLARGGKDQNPEVGLRLAELQARAKTRYLAQLDGLVSYVEQSTLVADEETRIELVQALRAARAAWEGQDAGSL